MPLTTIQTKQNPLSTFITYFLGIIGVAALVYFGGQIIKDISILKGKSALTVDVLNGTAEIYVNGDKKGSTPFESKDIIPGENKVKVKGDQTQYETSINFLPNFNKNIHNVGIFRDLGTSDIFSSGQDFWFEKDKSESVLKIVSNPSGASVYIDGTEIGKTPFSYNNLAEDAYDLRVEYPGYEGQTARINIKKGYTLNVNMKLFPYPVPALVKKFEASPNLYDLSSDNAHVLADTQSWVKAIIYWNTTRGINLDGAGLNKEPAFDYFIDYKGAVYDKSGNSVAEANFKDLKDLKRGAYLGRTSDGAGLTKEARDVFLKLVSGAVGGKTVKILDTGTGWLRVRDSAINGTEIAKVNVGEVFGVLEENSSGWIKIKVSDTVSGWVLKSYTQEIK